MASRSIRRIDLLIEYGERISVSCAGRKYMPVPTTVTLEAAHKKRPT